MGDKNSNDSTEKDFKKATWYLAGTKQQELAVIRT
jgi:hypothetical protein